MTKVFSLCVALLVGSAAAHAQKATPAKIGHLSSAALLATLPETALAETELTAYTKTWQSQYDELQARYAKLLPPAVSGSRPLADTARVAHAAKVEVLQAQLQSLQQQAQPAIDKKRQALYAPLDAKANKAIEAVAVAQGYDYVLDDVTGQVLYIRKTTNDLLPAAKRQLGLK